jgi:hypothetical protein
MSNNISSPNVSFADDNNVTFLIRWRGKQEGPYTAAVIEAKLAANQMGLLHEISHNGQWLTVRDYLVEREAIVSAERQARKEQERRAREDADQRAKERQEQRTAEALLEEGRKAAQIETENLHHQQTSSIYSPPSPRSTGSSGLRTVGILLMLGGLAIVGYFFLAFETSVDSGIGRINNLGLMADRQNGIIIGIGLGVVGTIMVVIGARGKPER